MVDTKTISPEALLQITTALNIPMHSLVAVIGLLDEGGTVPFIARYRKEATGNLDEVQIRAIEENRLPARVGESSRHDSRVHRRAGQAHRRVEGQDRDDV
jgi:transcriptional accessory protein Tex/SPT6